MGKLSILSLLARGIVLVLYSHWIFPGWVLFSEASR